MENDKSSIEKYAKDTISNNQNMKNIFHLSEISIFLKIFSILNRYPCILGEESHQIYNNSLPYIFKRTSDFSIPTLGTWIKDPALGNSLIS